MRPGDRYSDRTLALLQGYVEPRADVLQVIHAAARLTRGYYPVEREENPMLTLIPYAGHVRTAVKLCVREAEWHAHEGNGAAAVRSLKAGRRVAASLGECWMLIELLVRMAGVGIVIDGTERCLALCEMPPESLRMLEDELGRELEETAPEPALLGDQARMLYVFTDMSMREIVEFIPALGMSGLKARMFAYAVVPGRREADTVLFLDTMEEFLRLGRMPERERLVKAKQAMQEWEQEITEKTNRHLLSALGMRAMWRFFERLGMANTRMELARGALAVEAWRLEHGGWPDSLEQIVPEYLEEVPEDPFSGEPTRYVRTDTGVTLYSVGPDGEDDGGIPEREARALGGPASDRWDLPFRLLDPELRGARQRGFRDEIMGADVSMRALEAAGFDADTLRELGLTEEDVENLAGP
jgi:hypothetical protein